MSAAPTTPLAPLITALPRSRWLVPVLCVAFAAAMAVCSRGFLEPDEIMHFLYARAVWHDWRNLVHIWGRMGATGLFCLAAPAGVTAARLLAVAVMALTAHGTSRLLHALLARTPPLPSSWFARHATALVWLLLFAQPCFVLNSFAVMTEMLLACAWVWTAVTLLCRQNARGVYLAGALIGLGGLMRPEGWLAIAVWPIFLTLLCRRSSRFSVPPHPAPGDPQYTPTPAPWRITVASTLLALLPVATWYFLGAAAWLKWEWCILAFPWSRESPYNHSGLLFVVSSLAALAGWMWVPVIAGAGDAWKTRSRERLMLLVLPVAACFLLHGILGVLGLFGSMGLPRYFVTVAPLLAVLAFFGLQRMETRGKLGSKRVWRASVIVFALLPTAGLVAAGYLPMQRTSEEERLDVVLQTLIRNHVQTGQLLAGHPYVLLRLGLDPESPTFRRVLSRDAIASAHAGTILVTDSTVWAYENRPGPDDLRAWGYHLDNDKALIAALNSVPPRYEPMLIHPDPDDQVGIWIKGPRLNVPPTRPVRPATQPRK